MAFVDLASEIPIQDPAATRKIINFLATRATNGNPSAAILAGTKFESLIVVVCLL